MDKDELRHLLNECIITSIKEMRLILFIKFLRYKYLIWEKEDDTYYFDVYENIKDFPPSSYFFDITEDMYFALDFNDKEFYTEKD